MEVSGLPRSKLAVKNRQKVLKPDTFRAEEHYRLLFELNPSPLFLFDEKTLRILDVNEAMIRLYGWSRAEFLRMSASDIRPPKEVPKFVAVLHKQRGSRVAFVGQWRHRKKNGDEFDVEVTISSIPFDGHAARLVLINDITERKQTEKALRESERRYRELVQNANSAIIRWTRDGAITFLNEYAQAFFGYSSQEIVGQHVSVLLPQFETTGIDLRQLARQIVVHPERYVQNVNENVCRDGRRVWMAWTNKPVFDEKGRLKEFLSIGSDITARIQAETALRASEERLALAVSGARIGIFEWNIVTGKTLWTEQHARLLGLRLKTPSEEYSYRDWADRVYPEDLPRLEAELGRCMAMHAPFDVEYRVVWPDKSLHWVVGRGVFLYDAQIKPQRMLGVIMDVTDHKRAEEALRQAHDQLEQRVRERTAELRASKESLARSEARFRQMAENVHEVFWLADAHLKRMLYVSPAFEAIWGRTCAELYQRPRLWVDAVHPADRKLVHGAFFCKRLSEAPLSAEYRIVRPDGTVRWIADHGAPVRDQAGRVYRFAGVARDVTVRKEAEQALSRTNRALRAVSGCNEALLRSTDEQKLFQEVCRIIVDIGGYRLAWVGLAEHDQQKTAGPVAYAGYADPDLAKARFSWAHSPYGQGPTGRAVRTQRLSIIRDLPHNPDFASWRRFISKIGVVAAIGLPLLTDGQCIGALTIFTRDPGAFEPDEVSLLTQLANNVAFGVTTLRTRSAREQLERELLEISEREQRRIGQDLHDGLSQRIAAARFTCAATASRLAKHRLPEAREVVRVEQELVRALEETRQIARGLHPVKPGPASLMAALSELAGNVTKMFGISCRFVCRKQVLVPDHAVATHLFRIAQEATNNSVRHGHPKHIRICLESSNDGVRLRIEDDGRGLPAAVQPGGGLGLGIMRHRASVIGATIAIHPYRRHGTVVTCKWKTDLKEVMPVEPS